MKHLISFVAIGLIMLHILFPEINIDSISVSLLVVALLPWLGSILKSLEIPGLKIEYRELEKKTEEARKSGLLKLDFQQKDALKYSFQLIEDNDPNLALAGLRIELERKLNQIAKANNIQTYKTSIRNLIFKLREHEILSNNEINVLFDIIGLLNAAVHGAKVEPQSYSWAMEIGPQLLNSLEVKIPN